MQALRLFLFLAGWLMLNPNMARCQGFSPEEALKRMQVPAGLRVKLACSEPDVRQPVSMSFDDRGRLWVLQYLQYPTPAGLKPVKVDQYLRTVWDRLPEPPPKGPRGADKITIFEDADGTGKFRKVRDFVTGLNLASGMAIGHGGVFVAQPPYLLFYPDKNGDDVPDGDPEVLLTGFGMEDPHAYANSLQWGHDGWLYGAHGSTVTARIRGITFQQGIWRYHPLTRRFELFAEGGGNTWGLDFDAHGNALAGTNYGSVVMLHQVQGAYYVKGFAKHGELQNPYAYGYFEHVPHKNFQGGHVTCGGIVYQGGAWPKQFHNAYIAANPLANEIHWNTFQPRASSFTSQFAGKLLVANDTWFRPVDTCVGPDGSLFVADWYDKRLNHVDPVDNWDRSNGRIYKIEANGTRPVSGLALSKYTSTELVDLLSHANDWYPREARRILAERRDASIVPLLRKLIAEHEDGLALQALWAHYVTAGLDEHLAGQLLRHKNADVRAWTIRLRGDANLVSPAECQAFVSLAHSEPSAIVRCQLACTCKRLPGDEALGIIHELLQRREDLEDPFIPLLLWWAIEDKAESHREAILRLFETSPTWHIPMVRRYIAERIARRYAAAGGEADLASCLRLLRSAPGPEQADLVLAGIDKALQGRRLGATSPLMIELVGKMWSQQPSMLRTRLAMRLGYEPAVRHALERAASKTTPQAERQALLDLLGRLERPEALQLLLDLLDPREPKALRSAALDALQAFADPRVTQTVLTAYEKLPADLRSRAQSLLASRPDSTRAFLAAVEQGTIDAREVPLDHVRKIRLHNDEEFNRLVVKHWGRVEPLTTGEKKARIQSIKHMLGTGQGSPSLGRQHFQKMCATCHKFFGEGTSLGPELTAADRKDLDYLITSIVDPSAHIRNEYVARVVTTNNGRLLTGLVVESTPQSITLADAKNERTTLPRGEIESITPSAQSLMPEKLLDELDEQQIRDLLAFVRSDQPAGRGERRGARDHSVQKTAAPPLKVCLVSGSLEYKSDESLAAFQEYLEKNYNVRCTRAFRKTDSDLPGLDNLETCDVMLLFTRRLTISGEQLERVKKYCAAGKPIVALRTASHAFQNWLALDKEVLGGNYKSHYGNTLVTQVHIEEAARNHPVLQGVKPFGSPGSLYRNTGLDPDVEILLTGSIPDHAEPLAWTRKQHGGRLFYTSLGHPDDFRNENFLRLLVNALFWTTQREPPAQAMTLHLRKQLLQPDKAGHQAWQEQVTPTEWNPSETAIVVCDMWDLHWSRGATERVGQMAPRMNEVLKSARSRGVTIIHAPSETMPFYQNSKARQRVLAATLVPMPAPAKHEDPPQPIDASDGGSDTGEKPWYKAWKRQHPALEIDEMQDGVSDSGQEIWNFLHERRIKNLLVMGVHTNMCVLNRPFAIKAMVTRGMNVALVRDLTDTMYNPERSPYVSHDEGTQLVIGYIEKFWCPSISSADLLGPGTRPPGR